MTPYKEVVAERDKLIASGDILRQQLLNLSAAHNTAIAKIDNQRQALHDLDRQAVAYRATIDDMRQQLIAARAERDQARTNADAYKRQAERNYHEAFGNPETWAVCRNAATAKVLAKVSAERDRQRQLWGDQDHTPEAWLVILMEEVGEAAAALQAVQFDVGFGQHELSNFCTELIQVAAVAVQIVERIGGEHG